MDHPACIHCGGQTIFNGPKHLCKVCGRQFVKIPLGAKKAAGPQCPKCGAPHMRSHSDRWDCPVCSFSPRKYYIKVEEPPIPKEVVAG